MKARYAGGADFPQKTKVLVDVVSCCGDLRIASSLVIVSPIILESRYRMDWIAIISRWTHIGTAIVLVGGTFFLRFVVTPAAAQLVDSEHTKLKMLVAGTWKKFVHVGIVLFMASGFYNYIVVGAPMHRGDRLYHPLIGTKILLSMVIFFIASALVGRSKSFEAMRQKSKLWQTILLLLASVVVGISGYAKVALKPTGPAVSNASALLSH